MQRAPVVKVVSLTASAASKAARWMSVRKGCAPPAVRERALLSGSCVPLERAAGSGLAWGIVAEAHGGRPCGTAWRCCCFCRRVMLVRRLSTGCGLSDSKSALHKCIIRIADPCRSEFSEARGGATIHAYAQCGIYQIVRYAGGAEASAEDQQQAMPTPIRDHVRVRVSALSSSPHVLGSSAMANDVVCTAGVCSTPACRVCKVPGPSR